MQLKDYWRIIYRRWWLIALVCVATFSSAYVYSKLQTRVYRSTIRLAATPSRFDYGLTMVIKDLLRQHARSIQTRTLAEKVIADEKLDLSPETFLARVTVSPIAEDYLIQIDVDDPDPGTAQRIANAVAKRFVEQKTIDNIELAQQQRDRMDFTILDSAQPGELNRPKTKTNVLAGALLGLFLGLFLAFGLEFLDDSIKTSEDVERYVGLNTLGTIPTISGSDANRGPSATRAGRETAQLPTQGS